MGNKLYVGNLPYSVRDADLGQAFAAFGSVVSAKVMMERDSGRSKGFGFVEMGSDAEAQAAIEGMHDKPLQGRNLVVNEARPMEPPMQPAVKIPLPGQISGTDNSLNTGTHPTYLSTGLYFRLLRFTSHSVAMLMVLAIFPSSRSRYMALTTLSRKSHGEIVFK